MANRTFMDDTYIKFLLIIFLLNIVIIILFRPIYFYSTKFEETITIKEKYQRVVGRTMKYLIVSENDTSYNISNVWWKGDFNKADDWVELKVGKTYKIHGFGKRLPFLSWFRNIYAFEEV